MKGRQIQKEHKNLLEHEKAVQGDQTQGKSRETKERNDNIEKTEA